MAVDEVNQDIYNQEDHQVAYIFDPDENGPRQERPSKRRRVSKQAAAAAESAENLSVFTPLLNGAEKPGFVQMREAAFQESWTKIDDRIKGILRSSNQATLDQVGAFVTESKTACTDQVPSAFVITGPNIASQDLLFEQMSETLQRSTPSKFVRLRSSEASTLKATLKKIIRDVTAKASDDDDDDLEVGDGREGRRYLDYDLEALHAFIKPQNCEHIFVAFQDSEGFDSSLLSELIVLFHSWRPRLPFTLLFGIATSVELLQARLLKSACQLIYGAQFDVIQTSAILETVFKMAVAAADAPVHLGPSLLRSMLDRQHDQVSGIQTFVMSLKYAYMCHFYANPLSVFASTSAQPFDGLQPEHIEASRNTSSFREYVEEAVEKGTADELSFARSLLEDDESLVTAMQQSVDSRQESASEFLRALLIVRATGAQKDEFSRAYVDAMEQGVAISEQSSVADFVRRMDISEINILVRRAISILEKGDADLGVGPAVGRPEHAEVRDALAKLLDESEQLSAIAKDQEITLRSKYSGQSRVMRTTVIAQRVQLSQDSATLTAEDKQFTDIVDKVIDLLSSFVHAPSPMSALISEGWLYDSRTPSRDVFVPRPRVVLERSLTRPHDYLSCACCKPGEEGVQATLPETALLYQLYLETSSLINVADLWSAFVTRVGGDEETDERKVLVMFYRALAELRALGFVKASKKKVDHIAKLKWL
ncbi:origin recognition complex subunit 3 N-terminus-domain-containing protein [Dactylonectria macrodidyma]|uniref:Origin recognition complex subunit 3 N-terminus-domain-containing protein n=1 Tax=Dactylonectria macrodidyma TaxID=307937 RepID=A0A9P9E9K3_9HYPO|nr:origin recognition complex subunit 3 N-terminus-domain-containing protein [Dactylonectria macrodidyma]